ncbi:MAG TPA: DedA family protein [Gaiellaceae bacterium]
MLVASISHSITHFVGDRGIYAVFVLMMIDSLFPAGSELVMVYAGALAAGTFAGQHVVLLGQRLSSHPAAYCAVALSGTLGYVVGSLLGWTIGAHAGRPFVERHGRLLHLGPENLERSEDWFRRRGRAAVLLGRVTPFVRSFISIPAGIQRMALTPYTLLTLAGSAIWCFALAGVGWGFGTGYQSFNRAFDYLTLAVVAAIVLGGVGLAVHHRMKH